MAEFTLINRRKNLIFLQSPHAPALALDENKPKTSNSTGRNGQSSKFQLELFYVLAEKGNHKSTRIHKRL